MMQLLLNSILNNRQNVFYRIVQYQHPQIDPHVRIQLSQTVNSALYTWQRIYTPDFHIFFAVHRIKRNDHL